MFHLVSEFIRCVFFPYAFLFVLILILFLKSKRSYRLLWIIISIMFIWRLFAPITSSRYLASFLVLLIVVSSLFFQIVSSKINQKFFICLFFFLLFYNIAQSFSGFRNNYIFDIKDSVKNIYALQKGNNIFIEEKEFKRIALLKDNGYLVKHVPNPITINDFDYLLNDFDFWNKNAYFLLSEKNKPNNLIQSYYNDNIKFYKEAHFITNKNKSKCFSLYREQKFLPRSYRDLNKITTGLIPDILEHGILKTCNLKNDIYVFQMKDKLYWIVGSDLDIKTKIVFRIFTSRPDLLPKHRREAKFENFVFTKESKYKLMQQDKYTVFEHDIPKEYPITQVFSGLDIEGRTSLFYPFCLSEF